MSLLREAYLKISSSRFEMRFVDGNGFLHIFEVSLQNTNNVKTRHTQEVEKISCKYILYTFRLIEFEVENGASTAH